MGYSKNTVQIAKNYLEYQTQINNHEQTKRYIRAINTALDDTVALAMPSKAKKIRHALEDKIFNGIKQTEISGINPNTLSRYTTIFYEKLEEELRVN